MDILNQYEKERSGVPQTTASHSDTSAGEDVGEGGFFIRLAMRMSGGMIQTTAQANQVLLGLAIVCILVTIWVLFG